MYIIAIFIVCLQIIYRVIQTTLLHIAVDLQENQPVYFNDGSHEVYGPAEYAIDNDLMTCSVTPRSDIPWMVFDLQQETAVFGVRLDTGPSVRSKDMFVTSRILLSNL